MESLGLQATRLVGYHLLSTARRFFDDVTYEPNSTWMIEPDNSLAVSLRSSDCVVKMRVLKRDYAFQDQVKAV